jgi:hypothetical protein
MPTCLVAASLGMCLGLCFADDSLRRRLFEDAPSKWNEYLRCCEYLQGTVTRRTLTESGELIGEEMFESKLNGACRLGRHWKRSFQTTASVRTLVSEDRLYVLNAEYCFTLVRKNDTLPWAQAQVTRREKGVPELVGFALGVGSDGVPNIQRVPEVLRVQGQYIAEVLAHDSFVLSEAPVRLADASLVRFRVKYIDRARGMTTGELVLDTANYWLPHSYELNSSYGRWRAENVLAIEKGTVPVCKEIKHFIDFKDELRKVYENGAIRVDLQQCVPEPLPPNHEFYLSAFGLEEPFGVEWPKPTPWFLYFSAGGFGLFFLALFLWRVLAKRQARGVS